LQPTSKAARSAFTRHPCVSITGGMHNDPAHILAVMLP